MTTHEPAHNPHNATLLHGEQVRVHLTSRPLRFYRHGWQSWALAAWLDADRPATPIRMPDLRVKDEDPLYATSERQTSAWVAAAELEDGRVTLLGALDLGGRIQLEGEDLFGFYESGKGDWFTVSGEEADVFAQYAALLAERFGRVRFEQPPRVWCSWYSLYRLIDERVIRYTLRELSDLPFDVVQLDDGWQIDTGDWQANEKFPSGMAALADTIRATGRRAGLWLSPLIVTPTSSIYREHPDWLLRDARGEPVSAGVNWSGRIFALDVTHPAVLEWLDRTIRQVRAWGYDYLKLDFLYAGAQPGKQHTPTPREQAYRRALQVMRDAAGDAYILACGAPVLPSLGLADGLRVGPDVAPFWINRPMSVLLNNPNHPGTQNAIRTSLHRLWLRPVVNTDPDVLYFRSRYNRLSAAQKRLLQDLGRVSGFLATSDPPQWLTPAEREELRAFLSESPIVERLSRTRYRIGDRETDFAPVLPLPAPVRFPAWLATLAGLIKSGVEEILPAYREVRRIARNFNP